MESTEKNVQPAVNESETPSLEEIAEEALTEVVGGGPTGNDGGPNDPNFY